MELVPAVLIPVPIRKGITVPPPIIVVPFDQFKIRPGATERPGGADLKIHEPPGELKICHFFSSSSVLIASTASAYGVPAFQSPAWAGEGPHP